MSALERAVERWGAAGYLYNPEPEPVEPGDLVEDGVTGVLTVFQPSWEGYSAPRSVREDALAFLEGAWRSGTIVHEPTSHLTVTLNGQPLGSWEPYGGNGA